MTPKRITRATLAMPFSRSENKSRNRSNAFTLVELLVVVSIIAILASIAIPNFLEAQTRAKVARVIADQRSLATALESYRLDNNGYPIRRASPAINGGLQASFGDGRTRLEDMKVLTTPLSYIASIPVDIFEATGEGTMISAPGGNYEWKTRFGTIEYWEPGIILAQLDATLIPSRSLRSGKTIDEIRRAGENYTWALVSVGPDGFMEQNGTQDALPGPTVTTPLSLIPAESKPGGGTNPGRQVFGYHNDYDPTNGTVSSGNIYRFNSQKSAVDLYLETEF